MKHAIFAAMALALAACTPTPEPPATNGAVAIQPSQAARYFAAAELAYTTAADGATIAANMGLIRGQTATELRILNREARQLLEGGKSAVDAARLFAIAGRLNAIAGSR